MNFLPFCNLLLGRLQTTFTKGVKGQPPGVFGLMTERTQEGVGVFWGAKSVLNLNLNDGNTNLHI